jgi:hypothetical protein
MPLRTAFFRRRRVSWFKEQHHGQKQKLFLAMTYVFCSLSFFVSFVYLEFSNKFLYLSGHSSVLELSLGVLSGEGQCFFFLRSVF